jgi:2-polyprenyl-3-methyl-5-hydroxy-6-metoxy-1,4-benzoquinol methylase
MAKKQPKLVLREACVADISAHWERGAFFEAGAGTGHMSSLFLSRGFTGVAHDMGESSRAAMRKRFGEDDSSMRIVDEVAELNDESVDYLLAFEVLEHIEHDTEVLGEWTRKLRKGGEDSAFRSGACQKVWPFGRNGWARAALRA